MIHKLEKLLKGKSQQRNLKHASFDIKDKNKASSNDSIIKLMDLNTFNESALPMEYDNSYYFPLFIDKCLRKDLYTTKHRFGSMKYILDKRLSNIEDGTFDGYVIILECSSSSGQSGVGDILLEHLISTVAEQEDISHIKLYVQANNDGAIKFYIKNGFEIEKKIENYYFSIAPRSALLMKRRLR